MKTLLAAIAAIGLASPALAAISTPHVAGSMQGWNAGADPMTETTAGSGIFTKTFSGLTVNSQFEFKITDGTWGTSSPSSGNSWLYTDGTGSVTITYDANSYADAWGPGGGGRIGLNTDKGTWTAVGDWQGWNNANPATVMANQGSGIYKLSALIPSPGTYQYKAVDTGTWDAIGTDSYSKNADTWWFTTTDPNQTVDMFVNPSVGAVKVEVLPVPEPATLGLVGLGLTGLLARRRQRA